MVYQQGQYSVNKYIRFKTSMLRSKLSDYSGAYIALKGRINVSDTNDANKLKSNFQE